MLVLGFACLAQGINRVSLQLTGFAFWSWAIEASPNVMHRKAFNKDEARYSNASIILFLAGSLFYALSLFVHFYYKR